MIEVTKINGSKVLVNTSLIELVEETPDTVITLTTGRKVIAKENRREILNKVRETRQEYFKQMNLQ
ncbi:MAG: flagellar FlbD family protein [Lachnospiraceae bacterium]|nr:flagellar FlbD family protein [Lachnospiraceae bacterium]MBQ5851046.1 flagellar FlbD family protein [Lachnospiraceae bacterium]